MSRCQLRTPQSPASQARRTLCAFPGLAWVYLSASLVLGVSCSQSEPERTSAVLELSEANFQHEVLESTQPVLVEFWAPWCQPCLEMAPTIDEFAIELSGRVMVGRVRFDEHQEIAAKYGVRSPPTVLLFRDGEVARRRQGIQTLQQLIDLSLENGETSN